MNYYDISNPNAPFTTGYQKGLWQKTIVQIYRVLVIIGGILGVCLIIGTGQREDYAAGMLESCMLLLVSYLVFDYAHVCEHNHIGKKDRKMESSG